jgi:hypothetical protein
MEEEVAWGTQTPRQRQMAGWLLKDLKAKGSEKKQENGHRVPPVVSCVSVHQEVPTTKQALTNPADGMTG